MTIFSSVQCFKNLQNILPKIKNNKPRIILSKFTTAYITIEKHIWQTKQDQYFEENKLFFSS